MTYSSFLCRCSLALTSNYSCPRVSQNSHLVTEEQCRLRKTSQPDSYRMVRPLKLFSCIFAFADWWHPGTCILLKTTGNVCLGGTQATKCVHTNLGGWTVPRQEAGSNSFNQHFWLCDTQCWVQLNMEMVAITAFITWPWKDGNH